MNPIAGSCLLLLLAFICSCNRDDFSPDPSPEPTDLEGEIEIFQIFQFQVQDLPENETSFEGTLGDQKIHVGRYSEDSLVFIIPFIPEGRHLLSLPIDGEEKHWTVEVIHPSIEIDAEGFFENFFKEVEELLLVKGDQEKMNEWSVDFDSWVKKYFENFDSLSDNEKRTVLGAMHQFMFRQICQTNTNPINNLTSEEALWSHTSSQTYHLNNYDLDQLEIILKFPDQPLYRTMALGLGVGLWYRNGLNEYLAQHMLEFPILRDLSFYKIDPVTLEEEFFEKLDLESGEPSAFIVYGHYQTINENDSLAEEFTKIHDLASFFGHAQDYRAQTVSVIHSFIDSFSWELPGMGAALIHELPPQAQLTKSKLPPDLIVEPRTETLGEDDFRLRIFEVSEGTVHIMVESLTGAEQEFQMEIVVREDDDPLFYKSLEILLKVSCPLIFRFIIEDYLPALDMAFGTPPYSLNWIQGSGSQDLSGLPPGRYEVEVRDALGCK